MVFPGIILKYLKSARICHEFTPYVSKSRFTNVYFTSFWFITFILIKKRSFFMIVSYLISVHRLILRQKRLFNLLFICFTMYGTQYLAHKYFHLKLGYHLPGSLYFCVYTLFLCLHVLLGWHTPGITVFWKVSCQQLYCFISFSIRTFFKLNSFLCCSWFKSYVQTEAKMTIS